MIDTTTTTTDVPAARRRPSRQRAALRWLVSFAGFPLGGLASSVLLGPVDSLGTALAGGLLTGGILGAVQAWALGPARPHPGAWVLATAAGLAAGLGLGASLVDYRTDLGSLAVQGMVSGALVGIAQAVVLLPRLGAIAAAWPVVLGGSWAAGWAITTSAGIDVDERFTVFGASGAVVVTVLTASLPVLLGRRTARADETSAS